MREKPPRFAGGFTAEADTLNFSKCLVTFAHLLNLMPLGLRGEKRGFDGLFRSQPNLSDSDGKGKQTE